MKADAATYEVQVNWLTVVPLGDTLGVHAGAGFDDQWAKAFEVVVDEWQRRVTDRPWGRIDFEYPSDRSKFVVYVRGVQPKAQAGEIRRILDDVVKAANTVAKVGTHVYELARELREPAAAATPAAQAEGRRSSTPPPPNEELRASAA